MLSKSQKVLLFETIIKQYCDEVGMKLWQRREYWRLKKIVGPGICTRISNTSRALFGAATFAHEIIEFRVVCSKLDLHKHMNLLWEEMDINSRIEFLDECIKIC